VRVLPLTLAAGVALLTPALLPAAVLPAPARQRPVAWSEGEVAAADLLARARDCTQVSNGRFSPDEGTPATVPICGTADAVFWTTDMDIDCDGRSGPHCNAATDPMYSPTTSFTQSDGGYLDPEHLPYIVVPASSGLWDHGADGVHGGAVAAVVHGDQVTYAVVGDVGPPDIIGEASYATAAALGIRADPSGGGAPSGVTYIVFRDSTVNPIEDHAAAVATGERLARLFVQGA
jgi:hypothetical protein